MKTFKRFIIFSMCVICTSSVTLAQTYSSWGFGVRQHADQPDFPDIPFGDDDVSYGLSAQAGDAGGYWQGALLYTSDIEGMDDLDYALTPQINLILSENHWRMGAGAARTYIKSDTESGWRDLHWQLLLGLGLPGVGKTMKIEIQAIYVFDKWSNVSDFDTGNLEYALWIGFPF